MVLSLEVDLAGGITQDSLPQAFGAKGLHDARAFQDLRPCLYNLTIRVALLVGDSPAGNLVACDASMAYELSSMASSEAWVPQR